MAVFTIFQSITLEGWTPLMYILLDSTSNPSWMYMTITIIVFGYLVVNLYCCVIVSSFQNQRAKNPAFVQRQLITLEMLLESDDPISSDTQPAIGKGCGNGGGAQVTELAATDTLPQSGILDEGEVPESSMAEDLKNAILADQTEEEDLEPEISPEEMEKMMKSESPEPDTNTKQRHAFIRAMSTSSSPPVKEPAALTQTYIQTVLGGETTETWRKRMQRESYIPGCLLYIWRSGDPLPSPEDPDVMSDPMLFDSCLGRLLASCVFDNVIMGVITINVILMAVEHDGQSDAFTEMLDLLEVVCALIFLAEMLLKWCGYKGLVWYFSSPASTFDCVLVISSLPAALAYLLKTPDGMNLSMVNLNLANPSQRTLAFLLIMNCSNLVY